MTNPHGSYIWYELLTSDQDVSRAFYEKVVGWTIDTQGMGGMDYRMIHAPDGMIGGSMAITADMQAHGAKPVWLGYFGVDDVDATVEKLKGLGGNVLMPPWDIEGVGRLAFVTDPQGAPFYVMRGASDENSTAFSYEGVGHVCWNELITTDQPGAIAFYAAMFDIQPGDAMPMGEMGDYRFLDHAGAGIGAVMFGPPGAPPMWNYYFRVADIDAATDAIAPAGGTVLEAKMPVPGGDLVTMATDPHGARFGVVGKGEAPA